MRIEARLQLLEQSRARMTDARAMSDEALEALLAAHFGRVPTDDELRRLVEAGRDA